MIVKFSGSNGMIHFTVQKSKNYFNNATVFNMILAAIIPEVPAAGAPDEARNLACSMDFSPKVPGRLTSVFTSWPDTVIDTNRKIAIGKGLNGFVFHIAN